MNTPTNTNDILQERGTRYGTFVGHAEVTQDLKRCMAKHLAKREKELTDDQWESLEMIAHKIGRIINGDPNYHDSWADIAGYAKLVADRLETGKEA
jgi:predicted transglutaminase-like cysteine proteinase